MSNISNLHSVTNHVKTACYIQLHWVTSIALMIPSNWRRRRRGWDELLIYLSSRESYKHPLVLWMFILVKLTAICRPVGTVMVHTQSALAKYSAGYPGDVTMPVWAVRLPPHTDRDINQNGIMVQKQINGSSDVSRNDLPFIALYWNVNVMWM